MFSSRTNKRPYTHFGEYEGTRVLKKKLTKINRSKVTQLFSGTGNETETVRVWVSESEV